VAAINPNPFGGPDRIRAAPAGAYHLGAGQLSINLLDQAPWIDVILIEQL
jgi:hypothetical protein